MARKIHRVHPPQNDVTNEDEDGDDSDVEQTRREDERGRTVLAEVGDSIKKGHKIPLEWDQVTKIPCGDHKDTFSTYLGVIARERICITYKTWKDVPREVQNVVFESVKVNTYYLISAC